MKTKKFLYILVVLLLIVVFSCKNENNTKDDIVISNNDDELVYPLPTPFEITQMIQLSGTPYNLGLTNQLTKVDSYNSEKSKSINLGVYGADLAYAATYNQAQATRDILAVTKKLSDNLNISNVFDQNILDRVELNIQNQDSLYKIINNTYRKTFNVLNKQNQGATAILIIYGAWIESVYIVTQLTISSKDKSILMSKVAEQKYNINAIIPLLKQYKDESKDILDILEIAEKFKVIFDKIQSDDDDNLIITDEIFDELTIYTQQIRNEFVKKI